MTTLIADVLVDGHGWIPTKKVSKTRSLQAASAIGSARGNYTLTPVLTLRIVACLFAEQSDPRAHQHLSKVVTNQPQTDQ